MSEPIKEIPEGEGRSTKIQFDSERNLLLSYFDFSSDANEFVGGDVAYKITIPFASLPEVLRLIGAKGIQTDASDVEILDAIESRLVSFFKLKRMLEEADIDHKSQRDPWP
ncbi:MAG: hypothetical protein NXI32_11460 [bacterium]|nr:hypothetical protein [bacterium]